MFAAAASAQEPPATEPEPPELTKCGKDTDCKGEQLCVDGFCIDPPKKEAPAPGCAKDTDCKGERICVAGKCAYPEEKAEPAAPERRRWRGDLSRGGNVYVRSKGDNDRFTSGKARVHGRSFKLKSSGKLRGSFMLSARSGRDYVRIKCRMNGKHTRAACSYTAGVGRQKDSGSMTLRVRK